MLQRPNRGVTTPRSLPRHLFATTAVAVVVAVMAVVVPVATPVSASASAPPPALSVLGDPPVMRPSLVGAAQLAAWVRARSAQPWRATVSVDDMAQLFVDEGAAERVAGDLAFVQAVVETGWFGFTGRVPGWANNFGGIGATDATTDFAVFRSARIGVRAQIQHLRAYADPTVTVDALAYPLESPRFGLVVPKGKAPTWGVMGGGNWATDPEYATKILTLYVDLLRFAGVASITDPFGSLDRIVALPGQVWLSGWAIDPDTASPTSVHIYLDGRFAGSLDASGQRRDVAAIHPTYGPGHGFAGAVPATGGRRQVCAYAINTGPGTTNTSLGCRTVSLPTGNPFGSLDAATLVAPGQVRVAGWAIDPDTAGAIRVHLWANGRYLTDLAADVRRADVGSAHAMYGPDHGYATTVGLPTGTNQLCAYAINAGPGTANTALACRTVVVPGGDPFGRLDRVVRESPGRVRVAGWAIDPDTAAPTSVHIYAGSVFAGSFPAASRRVDVGATHRAYGPDHGFAVTVDAAAGAVVCVFALNVGPGSTNTLLGCAKP
jgi:hypothetical protein